MLLRKWKWLTHEDGKGWYLWEVKPKWCPIFSCWSDPEGESDFIKLEEGILLMPHKKGADQQRSIWADTVIGWVNTDEWHCREPANVCESHTRTKEDE